MKEQLAMSTKEVQEIYASTIAEFKKHRKAQPIDDTFTKCYMCGKKFLPNPENVGVNRVDKVRIEVQNRTTFRSTHYYVCPECDVKIEEFIDLNRQEALLQ